MSDRSNVVSIWKYSETEPGNDQEGYLSYSVQEVPSPQITPSSIDVAVLKWYKRPWFKRDRCRRHCRHRRQSISSLQCLLIFAAPLVLISFNAFVFSLFPVLGSQVFLQSAFWPILVLASIQVLAAIMFILYAWKFGVEITKHRQTCYYK